MPIQYFDRDHQDANVDWHGNNVAFTCPVCSTIFVVSVLDKNGRKCQACNEAIAFVTGGAKDGEARIEWN